MFDITDLGKAIKEAMQKEDSPWDEYCPIIKKKVDDRLYVSIYLTEGIDSPSIYNELVHELRELSDKDSVRMYINNGGGVIDSAVMITDAMQNCDAEITVHLSGTVASAATFPLMVADKIEIAPYTHFMIHNYSGSLGGKGREAKDHMDFANAEIAKTFKDIYKGFLTDEEIEEVVNDKDKWMGSEEIVERWNNRREYLSSLKD